MAILLTYSCNISSAALNVSIQNRYAAETCFVYKCEICLSASLKIFLKNVQKTVMNNHNESLKVGTLNQVSINLIFRCLFFMSLAVRVLPLSQHKNVKREIAVHFTHYMEIHKLSHQWCGWSMGLNRKFAES